MFLLIPFFCLILIYLIFYTKFSGHKALGSWRSCFLLSSVAFGILVTAMTEFLSLFNLITFGWLIGCWSLVYAILTLIFLRLLRKIKPSFRLKLVRLPPFEVFLLCSIALIVFTIGVIAYVAPGNDWDSMSYHMPRVAHWIQDRNVRHYPTHSERQLHRNPGAEFAVMHLQVLSEGDRFSGFVQWFSMLASLIGVSLIAKQLGASARGQIFSAAIAATIPMGILQASGTMNDYVVSLWLVCFVYFIMLLRSQPHWFYSLLVGSSLGLAMLTKPSAYVYAFPFLIWYCCRPYLSMDFRDRRIWKPLFIIIFTAILINLGHYIRNIELYGAPLPMIENEGNSAASVNLFISNIIRHLSLHMGAPSARINEAIFKAITYIHRLIAVDINDPRTTFPGSVFSVKFNILETNTSNLAHLILIIVCIVIFALKKQNKNGPLKEYCLIIISAFMLFCFFCRWTPWQSRLHLPLFVLWAPFVGAVLAGTNTGFDKVFPKKNSLSAALIRFSYLAGLWLIYNYLRSIFILVKPLCIAGPVGILSKVIGTMFWNPLGIISCLLAAVFFIFYFKPRIAELIILVLILLSLPWLFFNMTRRCVGRGNIFVTDRIDQCFVMRPYLKEPYLKAASNIKAKGYSTIGLFSSEEAWEYPLWIILRDNNKQIRIEHFKVKNKSAEKYRIRPFNNFNPDIALDIAE
ncbi:MAG: glycosyltransferase family 39 protein [Candidatus Omnitrophica bacterium]|nr:glycosyltransferase family 39 protein [Candidatus Omnitrophota bacterium]